MFEQLAFAIRFGVMMTLPLAGLLWIWSVIADARWGYLAKVYAARGPSLRRSKHMQVLTLVGRRPTYQRYSGITTIGATEEGLWLSLMPGFSLFHTPLFIPWRDLRITHRKWVFHDALELTAPRAPEVRMIVYPEALAWIDEARELQGSAAAG